MATLALPLVGEHQGGNAALAVTALELLAEGGLPVTGRQAAKGLAGVTWRGVWRWSAGGRG